MIELLSPEIIGIIAAVLGVLGFGFMQRKAGKRDAENKTHKDAAKREGRGRDAVSKEQQDTEGLSNSDIVDRMRRRDGDFRGL